MLRPTSGQHTHIRSARHGSITAPGAPCPLQKAVWEDRQGGELPQAPAGSMLKPLPPEY